jgi:hypothetical protein
MTMKICAISSARIFHLSFVPGAALGLQRQDAATDTFGILLV